MAVILRFRRPPVGRTKPARPAAVAVRLPSGCGPAQPAIPAASPPPTRPATARPQLTARTRDRPTITLEPQANPTAEAQAGVPAQPGPRSPAHRAGDRPGRRRARGRTDLLRPGRAAAGPARRRPGRPPSGQPGRGHQAGRAAHFAARVHHRRPRRRGSAAQCPRSASHADPRTTMRYDQARGSLDRHATYIVAAYLAGAAR